MQHHHFDAKLLCGDAGRRGRYDALSAPTNFGAANHPRACTPPQPLIWPSDDGASLRDPVGAQLQAGAMQQARQLRQQSPEAQLEGILQHPFHSPAAAGDGRDSLAAVPMAAAAALATQAAGALRQDASTYSGSLEALVLSWRLPDICNARCISDSLVR